MALEVGQPPRDGHADPGRRRREAGVEVGERVFELALGAHQVGRAHFRGDELVVERRHEHRDAVVVDDAEVEQVLLRRQAERVRSRRRRGEPIDRLVDPGRGQRSGRRAGEQPSTRVPHERGETTVSERSIRLRSATTPR